MFKYFIRKVFYKNYNKESQEMLYHLKTKSVLTKLFCYSLWIVVYFIPLIPILIISKCEGNVHFSSKTQFVLFTFEVIYSIIYVLIVNKLATLIIVLTGELAKWLYFNTYTIRGKALSKEDFKIIERENEELYQKISTQECQGYCYSICFEMCRALKKGSIEFLAVRECLDDENSGKAFTMHVLYLNNGWAFDTFSSAQYPIEKLHKIYEAKIYKTFCFDEIKDKSYSEFRRNEEPELAKWAFMNDCFEYWIDRKEA